MDSLIAAAALALAAGDPLAALNRVSLRNDPPALALRGIAMAQLGDLTRAKDLLRRAGRAFGPAEATARARCLVAEAEISLVLRDLGGTMQALEAARETLQARGDGTNAAHAGYLQARWLLLTGRLDEAGQSLVRLDLSTLPPASRSGCWLVTAGIAMRRIRVETARAALAQAREAAREAAIPSLDAEVERAALALDAPAARRVTDTGGAPLGLAEIETLFASDALVVDACRAAIRAGTTVVPLAGRPVLFSLLRALAETWPGDTPREALLSRAFRAREADESHRARLRVEIGRLRKEIAPLARVTATKRGFQLVPEQSRQVAVIAPPVEAEHAGVLALLADGGAWSSSALALALDVSPRTVQRALEGLAAADKVQAFGRGRARRWTAAAVPGFPTSLLLPGPLPSG